MIASRYRAPQGRDQRGAARAAQRVAHQRQHVVEVVEARRALARGQPLLDGGPESLRDRGRQRDRRVRQRRRGGESRRPGGFSRSSRVRR